ncbi:lanC-like protein 3 homolog [Anopheles ziemanni]|uniref:lanC-like protein 3 homolog n=1 Tax=Anopheles coustani TaxID=139045 RepID=UPI00265AF87B|nr:lanC-like protein 3 homolog [Anopheles coustani]XP_058169627.1 lanC-like protein 3 homolog [Anopheles ziemanni]
MSQKERYFTNPFQDYCENVHGPTEKDLIPRVTVLDLIKKYVKLILTNAGAEREDLYVGEAGIAFMFWRLSRSNETKRLFPCLEYALKYISHAKELASALPKASSSKSRVAFLCGNAGIAAVSAVISYDMGKEQILQKDIDEFLKGYPACAKPDASIADEVLVGRAGYLHGVYWLNQCIEPKPIQRNVIEDICEALLKRGRTYAKAIKHTSPLMYEYHGKEYLGAAHGVSAILHALLDSPWFCENETGHYNISTSRQADIKNTLDSILSLLTKDGDLPTRFDSDRMLVHWCHGSGGAIYLFAKAYLIYKEEKYLKACRKLADRIWQRGLLRKGPKICHGVCGNGYAFLLMYRLTLEKLYLYRAARFVEFLTTDIFSKHLLTPDRPFSLYEGLAGAVCYLVDVLDPLSASFPFMDVFEFKF